MPHTDLTQGKRSFRVFLFSISTPLLAHKNRTGIIYHSDYLKHDTGLHPENKERLISIISHLKRKGMLEKLEMITPRKAEVCELEYIHSRDYIEKARYHSKMKLWLDLKPSCPGHLRCRHAGCGRRHYCCRFCA